MTIFIFVYLLVVWWIVGMWKYAQDFEPIETVGDCFAMFFLGGSIGSMMLILDKALSPLMNIKIRRRDDD
jgi:hypothetical protein